MALDLNDPELEFSDLVYAYQSWVMAVINDEKLDSDDKLLTDDIAEDALNSMRFLPGEVTSAIETSDRSKRFRFNEIVNIYTEILSVPKIFLYVLIQMIYDQPYIRELMFL